MDGLNDNGAETIIDGEGGATTTTTTTIEPGNNGDGGQGTEGGNDGQGNDGGQGGEGGDGGQGGAGSEPETLFFDGQPLPDFTPEEETPREKELRLQLEEMKRQQGDGQRQQKLPVTEPEKPKRDSFYSDDEYENALRQYFTDHDDWKQHGQRQEQAAQAHQAQFQEAVSEYAQKRQNAATKLKDFDRIEKYADDNLNPDIVAAILFGGKNGTFSNTPEMLYAIGRNPDLMKQLNETSNPFLAGAMLLDISKKSGWAPAAPAKTTNSIPEVHGGANLSLDAELEQAEAEAERTGDRTRVIELNARIRERNAKK